MSKKNITKILMVILIILISQYPSYITSGTEQTTSNSLPAESLDPPYNMNTKNFKIIAHRADYYGEPENSLYGINDCKKYKVSYAEIDVQESKDGVVVVMHDYNLKRLTHVNKDVSDLTYKELEQLRIHSFGGTAKIPTLQQVISASKGKLNLIIEIKPYWNTYDLTKKVVTMMKNNNIQSTSMIHSLSYPILVDVKRLDPSISTGYIVTGPVKNLTFMKVNFFSIEDKLLTKKLVRSIHSSDKKVYSWTVDKQKAMNASIRFGVDGIITNKPAVLKSLIYDNE